MYIFAVIIFAIKQRGDIMFKFLKLNSTECCVSKKKEELKKAIVSREKIIVAEGMLATPVSYTHLTLPTSDLV